MESKLKYVAPSTQEVEVRMESPLLNASWTGNREDYGDPYNYEW